MQDPSKQTLKAEVKHSSLIHTMSGLCFLHNLRHQKHAVHTELHRGVPKHKLESDKFIDPKRRNAFAAYLVHIYTHNTQTKANHEVVSHMTNAQSLFSKTAKIIIIQKKKLKK